ncbi:nitroreductase [Acetobacteraceae bacterium]|nr:nitroreductase [Acetobacteraceae bacterium]
MATSFPVSLEALLARQSVDAPQAPAPQGEILNAILKSALCAPDHGRIRPWRFVVIDGQKNCAILGKKIAQAAHRQNEEIGEKKLGRLERRFADAPMAIAIGAEYLPDCAIPRSEQEYSVAAGAMNILNALSFSGFGGVWVSGAYGEDAQLRQELGLSEDPLKGGLLGFLLVGSEPERMKGLGPKKRPALEDHVLHWPKA